MSLLYESSDTEAVATQGRSSLASKAEVEEVALGSFIAMVLGGIVWSAVGIVFSAAAAALLVRIVHRVRGSVFMPSTVRGMVWLPFAGADWLSQSIVQGLKVPLQAQVAAFPADTAPQATSGDDPERSSGPRGPTPSRSFETAGVVGSSMPRILQNERAVSAGFFLLAGLALLMNFFEAQGIFGISLSVTGLQMAVHPSDFGPLMSLALGVLVAGVLIGWIATDARGLRTLAAVAALGLMIATVILLQTQAGAEANGMVSVSIGNGFWFSSLSLMGVALHSYFMRGQR